GQGIAGSLISYFLKKEGKRVGVIDEGHGGSASMLAAGIVNPVTGRNFVCSWRIDEFLPTAIAIYDELTEHLDIKTYTQTNLIRALHTTEDENNWLARTADPKVSEYMLSEANTSEINGRINPAYAYGELTGTLQVHLAEIIKSFAKKWEDEGILIHERFEYDKLRHHPETGYAYGDLYFNGVIFCEGYQAERNPFFPEIGMAPAKGEVLYVRIPGANFSKMYKDKVFIVRLYDDVYWVGSGYEWNVADALPTQNGYEILSKAIDALLTIPYEIIDHRAAIRPTMYKRRPVLIVHPTYKEMYLFNGLGTKGASIGPFAAKQYANYILYKDPKDLSLDG
ncbi:MAG: FAD-binding oxidoreductase, partial [Saprospiraceae bacterium]